MKADGALFHLRGGTKDTGAQCKSTASSVRWGGIARVKGSCWVLQHCAQMRRFTRRGGRLGARAGWQARCRGPHQQCTGNGPRARAQRACLQHVHREGTLSSPWRARLLALRAGAKILRKKKTKLPPPGGPLKGADLLVPQVGKFGGPSRRRVFAPIASAP